MKRFLGLALAAGLIASLTSCGWYTNVPAQVRVKSVTPSALTVNYKEPGSGAKALYEAEVKDAVLTLAGDPGSIGATFHVMNVEFTDGTSQDGNGNPTAAQGLNRQAIDVAIRVEPSVFREDPRKDELGDQNWDQGKLVIGTGQMSLASVVNRQVLDYGFKRTSNAVTALVTLTGVDDAKFPTSLTVNVPVVFTGYAQ